MNFNDFPDDLEQGKLEVFRIIAKMKKANVWSDWLSYTHRVVRYLKLEFNPHPSDQIITEVAIQFANDDNVSSKKLAKILTGDEYTILIAILVNQIYFDLNS